MGDRGSRSRNGMRLFNYLTVRETWRHSSRLYCGALTMVRINTVNLVMLIDQVPS
jgi:hypothetical protein